MNGRMDHCSLCDRDLEPGEGLYGCLECGCDVCANCSLNAGSQLLGVVCDRCLDDDAVWERHDVKEDG